MSVKDKVVEQTATISEISMSTMRFHLVGTSKLVLHAMSQKGAGAILFPSPKKNAAERASTMKHEPWEEFYAAAYKFRDEDESLTRLYMPAAAFHSALAEVAIDMAGAKKAQVARLTKVPGGKIPIYGIPDIFCMFVRSADMKRTPDVHTVPALSRWACSIDVVFPESLLKAGSIANLLANAGIIIGIGDGRPGKGKLDYGCWRLCAEDDPEYREIVKTGAKAAQDRAMAEPKYHDIETEQLLTWFIDERARRVAQPARSPAKRKTPAAEMPEVPAATIAAMAEDNAPRRKNGGRAGAIRSAMKKT